MIISEHLHKKVDRNSAFLSDPGVPGVRSMGPSLCNWLSELPCADLTDGGQIWN